MNEKFIGYAYDLLIKGSLYGIQLYKVMFNKNYGLIFNKDGEETDINFDNIIMFEEEMEKRNCHRTDYFKNIQACKNYNETNNREIAKVKAI